MQTYDADATQAALPFERLIPALREAFVRGCTVPPRQVLELPVPGAAPVASLIMPAWVDGARYGVKIVNVAPGNAARGLPGLHAVYLLFDAATGVPIAKIDGDQITARRTAAASALAASYLAPADARTLLVVGAGRVAALVPEAYREVRALTRVRVWARRSEAADALAAAWRGQAWVASTSIDVAPATDLEAAVREADIVSCATMATEPLVRGAWLRDGTHLDLIGGYTPQMREADDDCFRGAAAVVDTEEALHKSGDLLGPLQAGVLSRGDVRATLGDLCGGRARRLRESERRTVFKSVGTALEDLAAAMLVEAHPA
ncbi:MAG: ornithine cyclodeaminase family protein [Rubrivivax sp.]|nr:ornithine cyclodeaminase family protein [Rubrivivax sp.]